MLRLLVFAGRPKKARSVLGCTIKMDFSNIAGSTVNMYDTTSQVELVKTLIGQADGLENALSSASESSERKPTADRNCAHSIRHHQYWRDQVK